MKYRRSILRGYDKFTEPIIARALHIPLNTNTKKKGGRGMKIPMAMLKKSYGGKKGAKKSGSKGKLAMLKKGKKNDNDGDE